MRIDGERYITNTKSKQFARVFHSFCENLKAQNKKLQTCEIVIVGVLGYLSWTMGVSFKTMLVKITEVMKLCSV